LLGCTSQTEKTTETASSTDVATNPLEVALKVPGAKPTLPVSAAKEPFDNAFIADAHKYWSNFHW